MSVQTPSPDWVLRLKPYVPGKPASELQRELGVDRVIKLASNENPNGPSPLAVEAMRAAASDVHIYPDPSTFALRAALADRYDVPADRLLVGNGSNELITLLTRAFCTPFHNVVFSQYAFIAYKVVSGAAGVGQREVPARGLAPDVDAMIAACDADTRLLFLANPNNPTGTWCTQAEVERVLAEVPPHVLVVLDEAYTEYVDAPDCPNGLALVGQRENMAILRTFSKAFGLAGMRVGWSFAPEYVVDRVNRIREPFNVGHVAQAGAAASLRDDAFLTTTVEMNRDERARVAAALLERGIEPVPSQTNFLLFPAPLSGAELNQALLRRGVIVRPMVPYGLPDHIRVSIGTPDENDGFLAALDAVLAERKA